MARTMFSVLLLCVVAGTWSGGPACAQRSDATPWTLDEARRQLSLHPDDPYLQYVALQLARNEGKQDEVAAQIRSLNRRTVNSDRNVDLFALFSAAHAIQETLQLDTMLTDEELESSGRRTKTVRVSELEGPTVQSHPWGKMLAAQTITGGQPEVSDLSLAVPEDQYFVRFDSVEKLLQLAELGDQWGAHMFAQTIGSATTSLTSSRLKTQLAIQTDPLTRPFYDMVVDAVAMTGSDLYFRTGTDTTLLFAVKQPELFQFRMNGFLDAAEKSSPAATRTTGRLLGVDYVHISTPDRSVHVFSAYPKPDLHVRSNSLAALERVVAAVLNKKVDGRKVARLGESTEFKYIRTLMPLGAEEEDGFIYLSDPFIRRIVGPELKLTARRRMLCYNHLRMLGHGSMLFQTQTGDLPNSVDKLADEQCIPAKLVRKKDRCPDGGKYTLSDDGTTAVCSHHGHAKSMTPCRDVALRSVTSEEADQYREFVRRYSEYWRRFFDPIAIRVQVTPEQYRAETIILPLIDNSLYSGMAQVLGGEPEPLDALPVPERNIFSMVTRIDKPEWLKGQLGFFAEVEPDFLEYDDAGTWKKDVKLIERCLFKGLGNQIGFHAYDSSPTFDFDLTQALGELVRNFRGGNRFFDDEMFFISYLIASLNAPVYLAVPVEDAELVDRALDTLDKYAALAARSGDEQGWFDLELDFYRVPLGDTDQQVRCYSIAVGPVKWRMFYARVGDGLYVASKRFILEDLQAMVAADQQIEEPDQGPTAHAMVRIRPENWDHILPMFRLGWAEASREACLNNLGPLSSVAKALNSTDGEVAAKSIVARADAVHAVHFFCPDGGRYQLADDGRQVVCTRHGTAMAPRQLIAPTDNSPMGRLLDEFGGVTMGLTFLEDGLHATVTIERE